MGIHHSEFDKMFSCLKEEMPISLIEAIGKWEHIKDTEKVTIKRWKELLEERSLELMDNSYSVGTAMMRAWEDFYDPMAEDGERGYLCISELRDSFFNESLDKLEAYEDKLIDKGNRYPCKTCGWFVLDYPNKKGYCNNFSIERNLNGRCVSEEE